MKLPGVVTAAYGGRIRVGKAISQGHGLFAVHFHSHTGDPNDQGTWTDLREEDENVAWVRGIPGPGPTEQALLAAKALT